MKALVNFYSDRLLVTMSLPLRSSSFQQQRELCRAISREKSLKATLTALEYKTGSIDGFYEC